MLHPPSAVSPGFASNALQLLQRVQRGTSPVELVYTAHEYWPLPPGRIVRTSPTLHISVFDSSFNPPTLAHLALVNYPSPSSSQPATSCAERYDARMLLLSVRNADKLMKLGDTTFVQRLEMMRLLSNDIQPTASTASGGKSLRMSGNVAIAVIDAPTFVTKSTLLHRYLKTRLSATVESTYSSHSRPSKDKLCPPSAKLTFLLGFDTLARLFSPKYYPSEQAMVQMLQKFLSSDQEDCRIVCAYRGEVNDDGVSEVRDQFIKSRRITFIDIGAEPRTYSSSEVRAKVVAGDETWRRLVTDEVANYIIRQGIYSSSEQE